MFEVEMKTSANGLALIKKFEGLRTKAYRDAVGVWTIGYGHTSMAGAPKVTPGLVITESEAESILRRDLVQYEKAVEAALVRSPTQNQFDAMASFCFNVGPANFRKSSILRHFNQGDSRKAADAFSLWTKAGGKVLPGLVRRRAEERQLFLTASKPVTNAPSVSAPTPDAPKVDLPASDKPMGLLAAFIALLSSIFKRKA